MVNVKLVQVSITSFTQVPALGHQVEVDLLIQPTPPLQVLAELSLIHHTLSASQTILRALSHHFMVHPATLLPHAQTWSQLKPQQPPAAI